MYTSDMTKMQTTEDHRAPLAPGEIRTHVVGDRAFRVMHTGNGSFAQASYRDGVDGATQVLHTGREDIALARYADAIEQAEAAEREQPKRLDLSQAIAECKRFEEIDRAAVARGESANWWERAGEPVDLEYNLPMGANMTLVNGEVGDSLRKLIDAYGEAIARGAIVLTGGAFRGDEATGVAAELLGHTRRADALKTEILRRFGGER